MAAIEGIGQSKLGDYIESKLRERAPGGAEQAHIGDSTLQSNIYFDVGADGLYLLEAGASGILVVPASLDSVAARSFENAPNQAFCIAATTNYIFVGAQANSLRPAFMRLSKATLDEKSVTIGIIPSSAIPRAMRRLSTTQVLGVGNDGSNGYLMVIDEDATLSVLHQYTVTGLTECVIDAGSVWAIGRASGFDFCYVQFDTSNFDVQRSKGVTIPELAEQPKAVAIHGTTLVVLGTGKSIVAIDVTTDTVLWSTRISDADVGIGDVAINDSGVYAVGGKSGDFFAIKFDRTTGAILAKDRVPIPGAPTGILVNARYVDPDLWLCGNQGSQTFGSDDHQLFRLSGISDTGESLTTSTITPSIADTSAPVKTSPSNTLSSVDGTSTSKSYSIGETTFNI